MKPFALITGASSGIGAASAHKLAERGYNLILVARRAQRLENLKQQIIAQQPGLQIELLVQDLSDTAALPAFYEKTRAFDIQLWLNNAGFGVKADMLGITPAEMENMIQVNNIAVVILSNLYANDYFDSEGAQLINVSSVVGYALSEGSPFYSAVKFFVSAYSENLAHELQRKGAALQVKILAPAATATDFAQVARQSEHTIDYAKLYERFNTSEEMADYLLQLIDGDQVVGKVSLADFSFELLPPQFKYLGK